MKVLRYILAILMIIIYIGITIAGNIVIWKLSKNRYIDPLGWSIKFTAFMIGMFFVVYIWLVILVLPDR